VITIRKVLIAALAEFDGCGAYFRGCLNEIGMALALLWMADVVARVPRLAGHGMALDVLAEMGIGRGIALLPLSGATLIVAGGTFGMMRAYGGKEHKYAERITRIGGAAIYASIMSWVLCVLWASYPVGFYMLGFVICFGPLVAIRAAYLAWQYK